MGGTIGVWSEGEGRGSSFWFTLPVGEWCSRPCHARNLSLHAHVHPFLFDVCSCMCVCFDTHIHTHTLLPRTTLCFCHAFITAAYQDPEKAQRKLTIDEEYKDVRSMRCVVLNCVELRCVAVFRVHATSSPFHAHALRLFLTHTHTLSLAQWAFLCKWPCVTVLRGVHVIVRRFLLQLRGLRTRMGSPLFSRRQTCPFPPTFRKWFTHGSWSISF